MFIDGVHSRTEARQYTGLRYIGGIGTTTSATSGEKHNYCSTCRATFKRETVKSFYDVCYLGDVCSQCHHIKQPCYLTALSRLERNRTGKFEFDTET